MTDELTLEQLHRLSQIVNRRQLEILCRAIQEDVPIPDGAWEPVDPDRELSDEILTLWRQDEQEWAETLETIAAGVATMGRPFDSRHRLDSFGRAVPLLLWGWLNPFGPTTANLALFPVPSRQSHLLVYEYRHVTSEANVIFGEVTSDVFDTVHRLFSANGTEDHRFIGGGLPTFVNAPKGSPLSVQQARELFEAALPHVETDEPFGEWWKQAMSHDNVVASQLGLPAAWQWAVDALDESSN